MNKFRYCLIFWLAGLGSAMASGEDLLPKSMFDEPAQNKQIASCEQPKCSTNAPSAKPVSYSKSTISHYEGILKKRNALLLRFHQECKYSLVNRQGDEIALIDMSPAPFLMQEGNLLPYVNKFVVIQGSAENVSTPPYLIIKANVINLH